MSIVIIIFTVIIQFQSRNAYKMNTQVEYTIYYRQNNGLNYKLYISPGKHKVQSRQNILVKGHSDLDLRLAQNQ